jgi:hypothetical protein
VLQIVADHRADPTDRLPHPSMAVLQGPAILFSNDKPFTDADFEGIQEIYQSGKVRSAEKPAGSARGLTLSITSPTGLGSSPATESPFSTPTAR